MRIIAGTLGGRLFNSPGTFKTHPMSDKGRGALFNILGDITGLRVLDPFAGSGALSFEALSRGAHSAVLIEQDRTAQRTIAENISSLGLGTRAHLIRASASAWLQTNPTTSFDLILCDPPHTDLQPNLLARLAERLALQGTLVVSYPASTEPPTFVGLRQLDCRTYADLKLIFYSS